MNPLMSVFLTVVHFAMFYCIKYPELNLRDVEYKEELLYNLTGQRINLKHLLEQYSAICPLQKQCNLFSSNSKHFEGPEERRVLPKCNCKCDYDCVLYNNCCPGNIYGYLHHNCEGVDIIKNETGKKYFMVSDCPPSNITDNGVAEKCSSEKQPISPVTSYVTNITYRNIHYALCNGEYFVRDWDIHITCDIKPPNLFKTLLDVRSLKRMYNCGASFGLNADKEMSFRPIECRTPSKSTLNTHNMESLKEGSQLPEGMHVPTPQYMQPPPKHRPGGTMRFLFSIHHEEWMRVESHLRSPRPSCDNGTYDPMLGSCRQLYCDEGRTLENSTCHVVSEVAANIVYAIKINLSPVEAFHTSNETVGLHAVRICGDVFRMCTGTISNGLDTSLNLITCNITTNSECDNNDTVVIRTRSHLHMVLTLEMIATRHLTLVETRLVNCLDLMYTVRVDENVNITFNSSFLTDFEKRRRDIHGSICKVNVYANYSRDITESPFQITHLMRCPQVELSEDEYVFNNETGTVFIKQNNLNKTEKEFKWHNSSVRICRYARPHPIFRKRFKMNQGLMKEYFLFSQITIALSLACLFLTFVTYCIFPVLRTLPGKNIMVLTYNLFLAQALLASVSYIGDSRALCTASGICLHYFWLSTFCAMNVCSYHMFKIFCLRLFESHSSVIHRRDFFRYLAYVHGAPVVVIVFTVTIHLSMSLGSFTGYGSRHGCFLSDTYSLISAFILPATVIFLMNIVFFLVVAKKIRSSPSVARSTDKNDFLIFVKICAIVGVSWPLQIVDGMLEFSALSFVATGLNGLQGVYIFISYVCNRRVICHFRSLIGRTRRPALQTEISIASNEPLPSPTSLTNSTSFSQLTFESNPKM